MCPFIARGVMAPVHARFHAVWSWSTLHAVGFLHTQSRNKGWGQTCATCDGNRNLIPGQRDGSTKRGVERKERGVAWSREPSERSTSQHHVNVAFSSFLQSYSFFCLSGPLLLLVASMFLTPHLFVSPLPSSFSCFLHTLWLICTFFSSSPLFFFSRPLETHAR